MLKTASQRSEVLKHLQLHKGISSKEAFELYGITRLSDIIFNLKKKGYIIESEPKQTTNRYGHNCNYVEYKYIGQISA